jgi:hypothetical protein
MAVGVPTAVAVTIKLSSRFDEEEEGTGSYFCVMIVDFLMEDITVPTSLLYGLWRSYSGGWTKLLLLASVNDGFLKFYKREI